MHSLITLLLLSFLSLSTSFSLVDTDNDPIQNGKTYYINTEDGPLTYIVATVSESQCPLVVTLERDGYLPGTPVKISSPVKTQKKIALEERVNLAFDNSVCKEESTVWKQGFIAFADKEHVILTGGDEGARSFSISESEAGNSTFPLFKLKYWSSSEEDAFTSNVGLYRTLLELTEISTPVWFDKAFDVPELASATS